MTDFRLPTRHVCVAHGLRLPVSGLRFLVSGLRFLASVLICLIALFLLWAPAQAAVPDPQGGDAQQCTTCHPNESTAWQSSPHASKGVTCESCHGAYVEGHPKTAPMKLDVESTSCATCHETTYAQWQSSVHGAKGVQCIGCHLSHSQQFRLTDQALCSSCHRDVGDGFAHTTHSRAGVNCIDCHLSTAITTTVSGAKSGVAAPSHNFGVVAEVCVGCHKDSVHKGAAPASAAEATSQENPTLTAQEAQLGADLADRVTTLERTNRTLQTMTLVSLGLGLGIGGVLGIIFVLVIGFIMQARSRK